MKATDGIDPKKLEVPTPIETGKALASPEMSPAVAKVFEENKRRYETSIKKERCLKLLSRKELLDPRIPIEKVFDVEGKKLGEGASGSVHLWEKRGHRFAVKVQKAKTERNQMAARREFEVQMKLDHPSIVRGRYLVQKGDQLYTIMDYVDHPSFMNIDVTSHWRHKSTKKALKMVETLRYVLKNDFRPSDISPGNVLVDGTLIDLQAYRKLSQIKEARFFFSSAMKELARAIELVSPQSKELQALLVEARSKKIAKETEPEARILYMFNWLDRVEALVTSPSKPES